MRKRCDVFEINAILLEPASQCDKLVPDGFKHNSLFYCITTSILRIIKNIVVTILRAPLRYKLAGVSRYAEMYDNKIVVRIPTLNNRRALCQIVEIVKRKKQNIQIIEKELDFDTYPLVLMDLVSLGYLPSLWRGFMGLGDRERTIVCYFLAYFSYAPGVEWFYRKLLKKHKPECVVLANDHTFITKPLELVCEEYGVRCVYVQHASVSKAFPELHFSCSFLDGTDALAKYKYDGKDSNGDIVLLGAARYDYLSDYRTRRRSYHRNCIGVAINEFDDNEVCNIIFDSILEHFPNSIIKVRSHPSMKKSPFVFNDKERIISTCATDETIIDYLDSIDLQISNDSGVHLDAILGGVRTIAFNLSRYDFGDNYEYLKNGLIRLANNVDELICFIKDPAYCGNDINKIRQYDESYGKSYAGHCSDVIAEYLLSDYSLDKLKEKYNIQKSRIGGSDVYVINE